METANELEVISEKLDTNVATSEFVKNSLVAVLHLHEQVVDAKEATLEQLKSENEFLKESIKSIQDVHTEDRQTVEVLTNQIKILQQELEFTKRKYKLMWNKAVENYKK